MARSALPQVLVDATPLRSDSGLRGIGRFVRDLLHGLEETRSEWGESLSIRALSSLERKGTFQIGEDLAAAAEAAYAARGTRGSDLVRARRNYVLRAAEQSESRAIHFTEPLGLPGEGRVSRLVTCHDLIPLRMPRQYGGSFFRAYFRYQRCKRDYGLAHRIVAISQKTRGELEELLQVSPARIDVIPQGLSCDFMQRANMRDAELRRSLGVGGRPYVVYVGYSDYRKNVEGMMAALAEARKSLDVELVWAGSLPGKQQRKVRRLARRAGVRGQVKLVGFVEDESLAALYRGAVAHLFLSRLEGFGFSVAEAMAAGCPVIVAKGSGSDETAGTGALHVDADDPVAAGKHIVRLAREEAFRRELVAAGLARVTAFDRKRMARDYVTSYARLLGISIPNMEPTAKRAVAL